jgi:hypothetical protein
VVPGAAIAVVLLAAGQLVALVRYPPRPYSDRGMTSVPAILRSQARVTVRNLEPYAGYGTWVDVYDFGPSFQGRGRRPRVTPADIDAMARHGVRTLYLQASQRDPRSPGPLADAGALAALLVRAQRAGIRVVGWYLPRFDDVKKDLAHLEAVSDFQVLGHRFDGVAVDIEWTDSVADPKARNNRLVDLSRRLRAHNSRDVLGAIVLPPVQTEIINRAKWPAFPWRKLAGSYDVWLPMGYWTVRSPASGYKDGRRYTDENVRRIRINLGEPDAPVHAIGGIGDQLTAQQAKGFVQAVRETKAIGASIYDWASLATRLHDQISAGLDR